MILFDLKQTGKITVQFRTLAQCIQVISALKLWEGLWRFKRDQNLEVVRRLRRVTENNICLDKCGQN